MAKVSHVPQHYVVSMTTAELREILIAMEAFCREYEVPDDTLRLFGELKAGFKGEVPAKPGPPLSADGDEEGAAA